MKFRTEYEAGRTGPELDVTRPALLVGSCFSDNIGAKMKEHLWDARVNPCGVLYNPASILRIVKLALQPVETQKEVLRASLTPSGGCWLFSTRFSGPNPEETLRNCLGGLVAMRKALEESDVVIVTLGTAFVYYRDGEVVSNCHKFPEKEFTRRRLTLGETMALLRELIDTLREFRPELKTIFTVSPVRHLRDGFAENARSKGTLLLAVSETEAGYFPAYEILIDDLRDYRFYADDLLHPSTQGIEYIWEKFQQTYLSADSIALLRANNASWRRFAHRTIKS